MAKLQDLIDYLKKGYTLECSNPNHDLLIPSVSPVDRRLIITKQRPETKERYFRPEDCSLAEIRGMTSIWEYGVQFLGPDKKPYSLTRITDIEQAIQEGRPHVAWGKEPKEGTP